MRRAVAARLGAVLMLVGLAVGAAGLAALAAGWRPEVPPWMVRVAMYKLAFIAALGLLAAGAALRREARRRERAGGAERVR